MKTLFKNAQLLLPGAGETIPGALGVDGETIAFVGESAPGFEPDETIDCAGDLLMSGFVNAHTHLPMTLLRGAADDLPLDQWLNERIYPLEEKLTGELCYHGAMLALLECIRFGVTTVNDMYFFSHEVARAVLESGLSALLSRAVVSHGGHEQRLNEAVALFREFNGAQGRIKVALSPHAEYTCSLQTLESIKSKAVELGAPVHVHVSETLKEHEECLARRKKTPAQFLDELGLIDESCVLAHCVYASDDDLARIARRGATVAHCARSNLKLGSGVMPLAKFMRSDVRVALATDGAASNNSLSMLGELQLACILHKGLTGDATAISPAEGIALATENGARALGFNAGRLQKGCRADVILLSTNAPHWHPKTNLVSHLVYAAHSGDVRLTMAGGRVLYKDGEYLTLDVEKILRQARLPQ